MQCMACDGYWNLCQDNDCLYIDESYALIFNVALAWNCYLLEISAIAYFWNDKF